MSAVIVSFLVLLSTAPSEARSSSSPEKNRHRARVLVDQGNALFKRGNHSQALKRFEEAYQAFRSPKILLNIAETHRALHQMAKATRFYDQFLRENELADDASVVQRVRDRLRDLEPSVGRLQIECSEDGAEVVIDDEAIGSTPVRPWAVEPGVHRFSVRKPGFETYLGSVATRAGAMSSSAIQLTPLDSLASVTPPIPLPPQNSASETGSGPALSGSNSGSYSGSTESVPPSAMTLTTAPRVSGEDEDSALTSKWWFWTGAALVVVGAAVSVGIVASSGGDDFRPTGELGRSATNGPEWTAF